MKTLLPLLAIILMTSCTTTQAGPSWGFSLGNGSGFYYGDSAPRTMPRRHYHYYQEPTVYVQGPQYYRSNVPYYGQRVRNYTGTPVVMPAYNPCRRQRSSMIIPNSWN